MPDHRILGVRTDAQHKADAALRRRAQALTSSQYLALAEHVVSTCRLLHLSATMAAEAWRIPRRQVFSYKAVGKWPAEAKALVRTNPEVFSASIITRRYANRRWRDPEHLLEAIRREIAGAPMKRRCRSKSDPARLGATAADAGDLDHEVSQWRDRLQARVGLRAGSSGGGEVTITFSSLDEYARLKALLGI